MMYRSDVNMLQLACFFLMYWSARGCMLACNYSLNILQLFHCTHKVTASKIVTP